MAEKQYSLLEMIRVAQGFNREEGYTVLPNEVVKPMRKKRRQIQAH
jgi:hypothetical protein